MKNVTRLAAAFALTAVLTVAQDATAQPPILGGAAGPVAGPAYSPYLNLLRRGNSPGVNYFGLVLPQMEFRQAYQGLQQQQTALSQLNAAQMSDPRTGLPYTGHVAVFMNTGGYFMNNTPGMNQARPGGAGPNQAGSGRAQLPGASTPPPARGTSGLRR